MILTAAGAVGGIIAVLVLGGLLLGAPGGPARSSAVAAGSVGGATVATSPPVAVVPEPEPTVVVTAPAPVPVASGVVCIDAGHQARGDSSLEPVGPGASEKKPKVAGGATGRVTRTPESLVNLQIALRLRDELTKRGVTVLMVRETQDVNISNSARASVANDAKADLFVRLHCDGASDSGLSGLLTLVPGANRWTGPIVAPSRIAGDNVHRAVIAATGARDRGVSGRSDLAGFNWATVPTVLVEMGLMSNADEDRRLSSVEYQQKLATGMADGIVEYLRTR